MASDARVRFGVCTVDTALVIRTWDTWLAEVTGIPAARALGQPLTALVPDLEERGLRTVIERVLATGTIEVLAPALHRYFFACPPVPPLAQVDHMRQRVSIGPIRDDQRVTGAVITIEDVTDRVLREREITQQAEDTDPGVRRAAILALCESGAADAIVPLTRALGDPDPAVRREAVAALAQRGHEIVHHLVETLRTQHGNFSVLSSILDLLGAADLDIVDPLLVCLRDDDADLRTQAALLLGGRNDRRAIRPLMAALNDADSNVQFHAIEALGHLNATEAVDTLVAIAERGDFFLSFPAIQALTRIGDATVAPRLVPLLADDLLRVPAVEALGRLADDAVVPALMELLNAPGSPTAVIADALAALHDRLERQYGTGEHVAEATRRCIRATGVQSLLDAVDRVSGDQLSPLARVLGWLDGTAVQRALARLLAHAGVRSQVVEALVRHGRGVVALLIEQLHAEDLDIRQAAVAALGRIGDHAAAPALVEALRDRDLAVAAAGALARIAAPAAFEPLLALVGDADAAIRQAAIAALNSIGHPDMPARIRPLLDDERPLVRESALKIAGYFGYPACIDAVLARCSDPCDQVRRAAAENLPFFDDSRILHAVVGLLADPSAHVRARAAAALGRIDVPGPDARAAITRALDDPDAWVRYFALRSIGVRRDVAAAPVVLDRLEHDPAGQVRLAAIEVLGQFNVPDGVSALMSLVHAPDPDVARAAIRALAQSRDPAAIALIGRVVRAPEPWRRIEAVHAIARYGDASAVSRLQWVAAADEDAAVADAAISALARVARDHPGVAVAAARALVGLLAEPACRDAVVATLSVLPERLIPAITEGLRHPAAEVRRGAIEALGRMRHADASRALEEALDDRNAALRAAAITELRRLGSMRASRKLLALARTDDDAEVRQAAVLAIAGSTWSDEPPTRFGR